MRVAAREQSSQGFRRRLLATLAALAFVALIGPSHAGAATEGKVVVDGLGWASAGEVNLKNLGGGKTATVEGEQVKVFNILEILQAAEGSSDLDIAKLPKIEIVYPKGGKDTGKVTYTGDQIRTSPDSLSRFFVSGGFTKMLLPGSSTPIAFEKVDATLFDPTKKPNLSVTLSPASSTIKTGQSVTFSASVSNADGAKVTYTWDFGDGKGTGAGRSKMTRSFTGKDRQFYVTLTVSAPGFRDGTAGSVVTIGKVPKPKKPKKPKDKGKKETPSDYGSTPGYGDYGSSGGTGGYGGYPGDFGSSPGSSSPTPSVPKPDEKPEPPVDDGLVEVTGELVSSSAPAATSPPGGSSAPETPATVTSPSSGEGIADWVLVVLGLGVLLGFGALVEKRGSRLT